MGNSTRHKVRNKALDDLIGRASGQNESSVWKPVRLRMLLSQTKMLRLAYASPSLFRIIFIICRDLQNNVLFVQQAPQAL